jgi:hypothetical protein
VTYRGHVEATFESAHKADVPGHKCSGTLREVPDDVKRAIRIHVPTFFDGVGKFKKITDDDIEGFIQALKVDNLFDYHGHSWLAEIDFEYTKVDEHFWGPDFGRVKDLIRRMDHHNLNLIFEQPTSEFIARHLYEAFYSEFGFYPKRVCLHEGRGNKMEFIGDG